jgi:CRP-like cAMP-binding protein
MNQPRVIRSFDLSQVPSNPALSECLVDPELSEEVEKRSGLCSPNADGVLFRQGDLPTNIYFVRSGKVELTMQAGLRIVMRVHAGTGSLIGLPAIIGNKPYTMTAKATRDVDVRQLSSDDFVQLLQDEPRLTLNVLQILAGEIHSQRAAFSNLMTELSAPVGRLPSAISKQTDGD